jgi:hypothetical protein
VAAALAAAFLVPRTDDAAEERAAAELRQAGS